MAGMNVSDNLMENRCGLSPVARSIFIARAYSLKRKITLPCVGGLGIPRVIAPPIPRYVFHRRSSSCLAPRHATPMNRIDTRETLWRRAQAGIYHGALSSPVSQVNWCSNSESLIEASTWRMLNFRLAVKYRGLRALFLFFSKRWSSLIPYPPNRNLSRLNLRSLVLSS